MSLILMRFAALALALAIAGRVPGLDVLDVSILFSMNAKVWPAETYPSIGLADSIRSGALPLLSRSIFEDQLVPFAQANTQSAIRFSYENWRVVAVRYDPCFFEAKSANPGCVQELRLVAQPINGRRGGEDLAMHLIYKLGHGPLQKNDPVVLKLKQIHDLSLQSGAATSGRPLGVHPGLSLESLAKNRGLIGELVKDLILSNCDTSRLMELAFTNANPSLDGPWSFFGGPVRKGVWEAASIDSLPAGVRVQETTFDGGVDVNGKPGPANIHVTENPTMTKPHGTDCASCHLAGRRILEGHILHSKNGFLNPFGLTGFAELTLQSDDFSNVRAFGYLLERPTVAALTANASALVADAVNRTQGWAGPTDLDCQSPLIRDCFSGWKNNGASTGSAAECLQLCRSALKKADHSLQAE